jgi:uncharacterized protein
MLRAQIYEDMKTAMKAQDKERLEVIRYLWSEIKRVEIDAKHELSDEEVIDLFRKEIKRRHDAVEQIRQAGRHELVEYEEKQMMIISHYLPALMTRQEVDVVVNELVVDSEVDFGRAMGMVMGRIKGKADGAMVQESIKKKLGK